MIVAVTVGAVVAVRVITTVTGAVRVSVIATVVSTVLVAMIVVVVAVMHGIGRLAHDVCLGAVPSACSAWWMASMTSARAWSFCNR